MSNPLPTEAVTHVRPELLCLKCGNRKEWRDCWNCGGEGVSDHDCGEDCCACLYPEDNVTCDICEGDGGWKACPICTPEEN